MRSSPVNAACPSFMWHTVGSLPIALSARMPPMPRMISCWMRVCWSPPYNCAVMLRSSGLFCGMLASSRYSGTRPTWMCHTFSATSRPGSGTETTIGLPAASTSGVSGRVKKSFSG